MHYAPSIDAVIDDNVYIGNLSAAQSHDLLARLGITHMLSVCPDYPSKGPGHVIIPVEDSEYEDLLIHMPEACQFIQTALDEGGKVLVHCVMGISRSAAVVCAYLMYSRHLAASAAITYVRQRRPQVLPNYGFVKQLHVFESCSYGPRRTTPAYISWKRRQTQDVRSYLNKISDTVPIIRDKLFMTSDFPRDPTQAESLLLEFGITHQFSIAPAQPLSTAISSVKQYHFSISERKKDALLLSLSDICKQISDAIDHGGLVLVHSQVESKACIAVCAYLMYSQHVSVSKSLSILGNALPLFTPTANLTRHLELFTACNFAPTSDHPAVQEWIGERGPTHSVNATAALILQGSKLDAIGFDETLVNIQKQMDAVVV